MRAHDIKPEVEAFDLSMIFQAAAGIGRHALDVARWRLALGGHVRTGMEDNVRLEAATLAPSNAALVRQLLPHLEAAGRRPASVSEARALLGLQAFVD